MQVFAAVDSTPYSHLICLFIIKYWEYFVWYYPKVVDINC